VSASGQPVPAGMRIDWDVEIQVRDGLVLRADVFRPDTDGQYPVVLSMGPYGKGLHFEDGYASAWQRMHDAYPEVGVGTSGRYQNWELADPEKWIPDGFILVRVDSRGAARSPGYLDILSLIEAHDYYDAIEWAGVQPWSNGRVGLLGISYYAINQWQVAALQPPHLHAICVWEGAVDFYRDISRHGGILCEFLGGWFERQVASNQHGLGSRGGVDRNTGYFVSGDVDFPDELLEQNRRNPLDVARDKTLDGQFYDERTPDLSRVQVPLLTAGNWGGQGLHNRGNVEGFMLAGSQHKWLEMHGDNHFSPFYTDRGVAMQKQFFGTFLRDEDNGWMDRPPVELLVRHPGEKFVSRFETAWPPERTQWTKFHLNPQTRELDTTPATGEPVGYHTLGEGLRFTLPPTDVDREFSGHVTVRLRVSSQTSDADIFVVLRLLDPKGDEVTFIGSNDPKVPVGLGWLRASHRALDPQRTTPFRPFHRHDLPEPLVPGEPVDLDIEIWPTSIVVPPGYTLELAIQGHDYANSGSTLANQPYAMSGVGPFLHADETDRPAEIFDTTVHLHFDADEPPYLLLPFIE